MKKPLFLLIFLQSSFLSALSLSQLSDYPSFCLQAANDDTIFSDFKHQGVYRGILEHVDHEIGEKYALVIQSKYPSILQSLEVCRENDRLGNPFTHDFAPPFGVLSPTTLRYMKVAGELVSLFGDLREMKIIEIGGGYGGQCKVLSAISGFSQYTIVDLPEVAPLISRYLSTLGLHNVIIGSSESIKYNDQYDLVISNYAFSEIDIDGQLDYIAKILNKSSRGYMTCNFTGQLFECLSQHGLLKLLERPGRNLSLISEEPLTAKDNVIIVWKPN